MTEKTFQCGVWPVLVIIGTIIFCLLGILYARSTSNADMIVVNTTKMAVMEATVMRIDKNVERVLDKVEGHIESKNR